MWHGENEQCKLKSISTSNLCCDGGGGARAGGLGVIAASADSFIGFSCLLLLLPT